MPSDRRWANTGLRFTAAAHGQPREEVARLPGHWSGVRVGTVAWWLCAALGVQSSAESAVF